MKKIVSYTQFLNESKNYDKLLTAIESGTDNQMIDAIYPIRHKPIDQNILNKAIERFVNLHKYNTPNEWFVGAPYATFMDFFLRKISSDKMADITDEAANFKVVSPCECNIEAIGSFPDTEKILRLKEPGTDVEKDLATAGIKTEGRYFVSMKLLRSFYHRIHSPCTGKLGERKFFGKEEKLFGNNSLWTTVIKSEEAGDVDLLLVGEMFVQDFVFDKKIGDNVKIGEEIGYFDWGSQVVMILDHLPDSIIVKSRHFVGDCVIRK